MTQTAPAANPSPIKLSAVGIDETDGGASVLVAGRLAEQRDGSAINDGKMNEGKSNEMAYASCQVEFWGGSCKVSLTPGSDDHRAIAAAKPGDRVLFVVKADQRSFKVGEYFKDAFAPDGKAKLLHIQGRS